MAETRIATMTVLSHVRTGPPMRMQKKSRKRGIYLQIFAMLTLPRAVAHSRLYRVSTEIDLKPKLNYKQTVESRNRSKVIQFFPEMIADRGHEKHCRAPNQ